MTGVRERPGDPARVIGPIPRAPLAAGLIRGRSETVALERDAVVGARSELDAAAQRDRHRKDEAVVVVGVLADEIDAARRACPDHARDCAPTSAASRSTLTRHERA